MEDETREPHWNFTPIPATNWKIGELVSLDGLDYPVEDHYSPYTISLRVKGKQTLVPTSLIKPPTGRAAPITPARVSRPPKATPVAGTPATVASGAATVPVPESRSRGIPRSGEACVVVNWDRSVPRQAAHWERLANGSIFVRLREGMKYTDGLTERTFRTVRQAKDETRSAVR